MEKMNLAIVSEGTLANITITPTLRDQIVAAQKNDVGMDNIRQRLGESDPQVQCFHQDSEGILWFKDRMVVPNRDGTRGCGCGFDENPPVGKPAGLEKTRPQVDPRVHFCTRIRTRGFRAGFGCPRVWQQL